MDRVEFLVVGAGVTGLAFANAIRAEAAERGSAAPNVVVLEADAEPGGYCKTIHQDGFVWDYSGHFFHFARPEIEAWLRDRMPGADIRTVTKRSLIRYAGVDVDFPFQKNIHQLPRTDFIDCLHDLYFRDADAEAGSFQQMLYAKFGKSIAEKFLIPYNEKLYATDLDTLDPDAMGRFFPHADIADIIRNMKAADNASYNSTFTYPRGGAIEYINALLRDLPDDCVSYGERLVSIDLKRGVAWTSKREIEFGRLVSSAPFNRLASMCGVDHDADAFTWNKVLVFNLGFDGKGAEGVHWMYFPQRELCFYRVGWYDNIMGDDRMSLYIEVGADKAAEFDVDVMRERVLVDLAAAGVVTDQQLVSWHSIVLDPAYVHITGDSQAEHERVHRVLNTGNVYSAGRYGGWTYCSIEDNIVEARELAATFAQHL
jgi:protoporphyrinogen oxidase